MCGLAGMYCRNEAASGEVLLAMAGELRHRGPDGVGLYLDARFGMVNTRLAIVDVEHGQQPLADDSGRFWAMQNGEIYNYIELRDALRGRGHRFRTRCDTEVLAHAFAEWGPNCLDRLNGDFAIAIWDEQQRELFLARDRFGVRPLYIAELSNADLVFGSEIKAILCHPKLERRLDPVALVDCFISWSTLPDRSAFAGIREIAPGTYMRVRADGRRFEQRWWSLNFNADPLTTRQSERELAEQLRELLADASRLRLRADVPVGVYLSGGLDSSLIAALAQRQVRQPLRAFSLRFADRQFDERPFQERVSSWLGVTSEHCDVTAAAIGRAFPRVVTLCERPLVRTAPVPLLGLAELVRASGFKVVLTGEGADELFGGYDIFKEAAVRRFWARQPKSHRRPQLFRKLYPFLGPEFTRSTPFLHRYFGLGLEDTSNPLYSHELRFRAGERLLRFFDRDVLATVVPEQGFRHRLTARLPMEFAEWSALSQAQYLEIDTFLFGYLLHAQGDRMMMGHSVEGRFPYLDHRVAEFAARLPDGMRLRRLREKHLLRVAAQPLLPPEIADRVKHPYRSPILRSFFGETRLDYVDEMLDATNIASAGIFDPNVVAKLIRKCRATTDTGVSESDEMALVGILSTQVLYDQAVRRPELATLSPTRMIVRRNSPESLPIAAEAGLR
jgi:asparagine synthase (glutamine-hydrolysing)